MLFTNKVQITSLAAKSVVLGEQEYKVYPCVLLVEGVHHGIGADPVYYPPQVIQESVARWNNVPVTIGHPVVNGEHVMCNHDGTIRQRFQVGYVNNARYEAGKLKADLYLHIGQVQQKIPELFGYLEGGGELEVSTGLLAGEDGVAGSWNSEEYAASVLEIIPDHLALLPGSVGACSWEDGCGVRVNSKAKIHSPFVNELSIDRKLSKIYKYLDSLDQWNESKGEYDKLHYSEAIYDSYFIYEEKSQDGTTVLLKQNYSFNETDELILEGEKAIVIKNITYEVKMNKEESKMKESKNNEEKKCCPEKVKALISNENNAFTETDKEWLEGMTEDQLEKLVANYEVIENTEVDQPVDLAAFLETAPAPIKAMLNEGLAELDSKRKTLIDSILAHEGTKFTADQLKPMETGMLVNIAAMIPKKQEESYPAGNYGMTFPAHARVNEGEEVEPYVPVTLSDRLGKKEENNK
jgi:hypothetical protein